MLVSQVILMDVMYLKIANDLTTEGRRGLLIE